MKAVKQFKWLIASLVFLVFCGINNPVQALEATLVLKPSLKHIKSRKLILIGGYRLSLKKELI